MWKVRDVVSERKEFCERLRKKERMSDLCREYGISRKTGYKFQQRFKEYGLDGLDDRPPGPRESPHRTAEATIARIIALRREHSTWGPRKLKAYLAAEDAGIRLPAASTIDTILRRNQLIEPRRRHRRTSPYASPLAKAEAPNDVWCTDFKGQFRLGNGRYCYPLTITDRFSRAVLGCEALEGTDTALARPIFERAFRNFGLPRVIRSDNGVPFSSTGLLGLSRLSIYWIRLGIRPERIAPGNPQQNGQHERMHLVLKQETTRPAGQNLLDQQERFDRFIHVYNEERPHDALGLRRPGELYSPSPRVFPNVVPDLSYPLHDESRVVLKCGHIFLWKRSEKSVFISAALAGERVGLRELADDQWLVSFAEIDLGIIDRQSQKFQAIDVDKETPEASEPSTPAQDAGQSPLNAEEGGCLDPMPG